MSSIQGPTPAELSSALAEDIERVVDALCITVKRTTPRKLYCFSPHDSGRAKLEVEVSPIRGKWNDWGMGKYGDALGLVAYARGFSDPKSKPALTEAIAWAKDHLGIQAASFNAEAWAERQAELQRRQKEREAKAARELGAHRKTANGLWLRSAELLPGTAGWDYLVARGIDLAALPRRPRAVRFSQTESWYDDEGQVRHVGPALMAAMMLRDGRFGSLHRTWIDPDRPGDKADLSHIYDRANARKMWPASAGAAIPLWRGESGLSAREATGRNLIEDMVVCEGIETGWSIALMTPETRVEAAGSLPGLLSWVPPKHVRCVTIAADNDWGKPQCQAQLDAACRRLSEEFGKLVRVARSPVGSDFNDLLKDRS